MEYSNKLILSDLGEFRILDEIILPKLKDVSVSTLLGDDCAFAELPQNGKYLAVTTDITPKPLVWELGYKSYYTWGWYSVLINISDLASSGADPVAFTTSIEAPSSMLVSDLEDFFSGVHDACKEIGIPNAGGNINEGRHFSCHGTAIGTVPVGQKITRSGVEPSDEIYIIGESGYFISLYIKARKLGFNSLTSKEADRLLKPTSLLKEMRVLRDAGVLSAASDNSDGLAGTLWNLAERSKVGIELNLNDDVLSELLLWAASIEQINPWNLFFCWGDWQQVVVIKQESKSTFESIVKINKINHTYLGSAIDKAPILFLVVNGRRRQLKLLRNENFRKYSYNNIAALSLDYMLHASLFNEEEV